MKRSIIILVSLVFISCNGDKNYTLQITSEKNNTVSIIDSTQVITQVEITPNNCIDELINAAKGNNLELARTLLQEGCDVNGTIKTSLNTFVSPLRYGIHHDDSEMAKLLLSYGADPCQNLGRGMTPFHYSAGGSIHETFQLLTNACDNVNVLNDVSNFPTPLFWAIKKGKIDHVKMLLDKGVKINPDLLNGMGSPLSVACAYNRFDIFKLLLERGADVNAQFSHPSEDCIPCPNGITVLHQLIYMNDFTDKNTVLQFLNTLIKYNPNINIESKDGFTPLEYACFGSDTDIVAWLMSYGAKIETKGYAAIHCASMFSNYPMVEFLLKMGADPNTRTTDGSTSLMVSYNCCGDGFGEGITDTNRVKTAKLLLDFGANPFLKNDENKSFSDACKSEYRRSFCDSIDITNYLKE